MKRFTIIMWLCFVLSATAFRSQGQNNVNYSSVRSYKSERVYLDATGSTSSPRTVSNVCYLDGFGRRLQEIQVGGSPDGSDLILPYAYGPQGRLDREYLSYARSNNHGAYHTNAYAASNWSAYGSDQSAAFTLNAYDESPLNRVVKRTGPGAAWHTAQKGVATAYGHNLAGEVRLYRVASDGSLSAGGSYAPGRLEKVTVTDEDGKSTVTYTDNAGKTVLAVNILGNTRLETYSVYDDRGLLRWVLSPEASYQLGSGVNSDILNKLAYRYDYDRWDRMILKKLPGCEAVYHVYDKKDRLVLSQDGNQRSTDKWGYTLYDSKNRAVESGEVVISGKTHAQLQGEAGASDSYIPSGSRSALLYTLYDSYTPSSLVTPRAFAASPGYSGTYHQLVTGKITATKMRILGTDTWQTATLYYDDRGGLVQTVADNCLGGVSRIDLKYDFTGNLLQQRESHGKSGGGADIVEYVNTYDVRGRLLTQTTRLNGGAAASIVYQYDVLGRLTGKKYGSLSESLSYNARGWVTGKESTLFRMLLRYDSPRGGGSAFYNGNISEWEWQQGSDAALMYGFAYDGMNRFTGAAEKQKTGSSWVAFPGHHTEQGVGYDRNGNLLGLQRTAGGSLVDDLVYGYTGNQLSVLTENIRTSAANDIYAAGGSASGSYSYDANGNLQTDSRNALNFSYNVLNLVSEVRSGGTLRATYSWLADGTKLGVRDGGGVNGFEYTGSLIYRKSSSGLQLSEAQFGDGVIRIGEGGVQEVNYFLKDHLGSVRVIAGGNGTVKERNDYYPFGARHVRSDYVLSTNRWKYNGKEEQTTGDLGYLDYGARMYDAALGRWMTMDLLSENYKSQSPYHFSGNNPLAFIDDNGMDYWSTSNPALIAAFMNSLRSSQGSYSYTFDMGGWNYASDRDFLDGLTYSRKSGRFFFDYGDVFSDVATRFAVSLPGHVMLDGNMGIRTMHGIDETRWYNRASGRADQDYTIDAMLIPVGRGLNLGMGWVGKWLGRVFGGGKTLVNQGCEAILKNGYYEINGFKFSEYYYNKLWNTGRGAPSLVAKEVLAGGVKTAEPYVAKTGFYKYVSGGWEMIYNPLTKEVWHLQPIK